MLAECDVRIPASGCAVSGTGSIKARNFLIIELQLRSKSRQFPPPRADGRRQCAPAHCDASLNIVTRDVDEPIFGQAPTTAYVQARSACGECPEKSCVTCVTDVPTGTIHPKNISQSPLPN